MAGFSTKSTLAIDGFVENMGMGPITPAKDRSYSFEFERAGLLSFTPSADRKRVIMALKAKKRDRVSSEDMFRFLSIANIDPVTRTPISAGMIGGSFVLATNVLDEIFNLQLIELCFDRLVDLHERVS